MKTIRIEDVDVGPGRPAFVIAEIGVNHDGSLARAVELVGHAKAAGADAIKLQLFTADNLVHASAGTATYQQEACGATDQTSLLRALELSEADVAQVIEAASAVGLVTIATPFSIEDVDTIARLKLPAIKIASPDLMNKPLLARAASLGRPLLISTGASTVPEIERCAEWMREWRATCSLLHCVSAYPTSIDDARLGWIAELARHFDVPIGYSDHTTELLAGAFAVGLGACVIEKHLTWNRDAEGPDHRASADPAQFAAYVEAIRTFERLHGPAGAREVLPIEEDVRRLSRQSLVLRRDVKAGEPIQNATLRVQRPGTGILASEIDTVLGRRASRDLPAGTILAWEMLADGT